MKALIFQSDFGLCDGAVAAMHGVAYSEDPKSKNLQFNTRHTTI